MDPSQQRYNKADAGSEPEDESGQAGFFLSGGVVLIVVGIILIAQSHANVAHFAGAMLAFIGLMLAAAAIWIYASKPGDA